MIDPGPRPADVCADLLAALDATEGRRRKRKRDTRGDTLGIELKRALLERAVREDPEPGDFEGWLLERVLEVGHGSGGTRAMAMSIWDEWRLARAARDFRGWLESGAPSDDRPGSPETPGPRAPRGAAPTSPETPGPDSRDTAGHDSLRGAALGVLLLALAACEPPRTETRSAEEVRAGHGMVVEPLSGSADAERVIYSPPPSLAQLPPGARDTLPPDTAEAEGAEHGNAGAPPTDTAGVDTVPPEERPESDDGG